MRAVELGEAPQPMKAFAHPNINFRADRCTTECLGTRAAKPATRFEALEPLRQAVRGYCGRLLK